MYKINVSGPWDYFNPYISNSSQAIILLAEVDILLNLILHVRSKALYLLVRALMEAEYKQEKN